MDVREKSSNEKRLIDVNDIYSLFNQSGIARLHVSDIDKIPRVDAVEVVHGRWIEPQHLYYGAKQYECSLCYSDIFWKKHSITEKYPHCPNCGCRMDGGNDE